MGSSAIRAGEAFIELTTRDTKLAKGLLNAQAQLKTFGNAVNDIGMKFTAMTAAMTVSLGFVTKNFADFDDQMRIAKAKSEATEAEFEKMTELARKLGRETSYTAAQVAQGMAAMAAGGFKAEAIMKSIGDFMNLDRATSMNNLAESIRYATAAMNSFGLSAADASRISDVLTATANGSSQNMTDLGEALSALGANANMSNVTLEDTCAMLGVLANMGIKGSAAGTALARTFQRLVSGKGVAVLDEKKIKTSVNGNLRNMRDILTDIAKVTQKMGSAEKLAFLTEVFDVRGLKGGGVLSGELKSIDAMMEKIAKSGGLAKKTAQEMDSGIGGALRIFNSALSDVGLEIGKIVGEYIRPYMDAIGGVLNHISEWAKANKVIIIGIVKVGAAVGVAGAALLALGMTTKVLAFSCGGLALALRVVATAVFLPLRAFGLLAAVFGLVKTAIIGIPALLVAVKTACIAAVAAVNALGASGIFVKASMLLLAGAVGVAKLAILAAMGAVTAATLVIRGLMLGLTGLKIAVVATFSALAAAKAAFLGLNLAITAPIVAIGLLHIAMAKIQIVFAAISGVVLAVKSAIAGFNIAAAVSTGIAAAWSAALAFCQTVVAGFSAAFGTVKAAITGFNIAQAVSTGIMAAWNAVAAAGHAVMAALTGAFAAVKAAVLGFNLAAAASHALMVAWNGIVVVGKTIWAAFVSLFGAAKAAVAGFNIVQAVGTALQTAYNAVMHAGTVVVGIFTSALAALKTVFLGLKVAAVASWTAVIGPALVFVAAAGAVVAVVLAMTDAFKMIWESIKELGSGFSAAFGTIKKVAKETYEAIKIAFSAGDLAGAAKVGLAALKVVWLAGIMPLKKAWYDFKFFLADSWTIVSSEILKLGNNMWYGLLIGLKAVGNGIANAWDALWNGVIGAFEKTVGTMKKKWIQFKGFFDSDEEIEAKIREVDEEIAANQSERARRSNAAVNRRNAEMDQLKAERDRKNSEIDRRTQTGMAENRADYDRSMREAAQGLEDAQRDWKAAMDEVKKKAAEKSASPTSVEAKIPKIEQIQTSLAEKTGGKAVAGFDARALAGLFGNAKADSTAERQAKSSENIERTVRDISTKLDKTGSIRMK